MPSGRLSGRVSVTPAVREKLREHVDNTTAADTYDDYLRVVLGMPQDTEKAN